MGHIRSWVSYSVLSSIDVTNHSLVLAAGSPCIQAQGNYDGAPVVIGDCGTFNSANVTWTVVNGGATVPRYGPYTQIKIFGDKCLDVTEGGDWDGNKLQIWTCYEGSANQMWQANTDETIKWAGHNRCVESHS
jgi:hypothetical protein